MGKLDSEGFVLFFERFFFGSSAYVASKNSTLTLPPACIFSWNSTFAATSWTKFAVFQHRVVSEVVNVIITSNIPVHMQTLSCFNLP